MNLRVIFLILFSFTTFNLSAEEGNRIKIGISAALSGAAANFGLDVRDAVRFAVEKFGKDKYELIIEDDKCNSREAVTIANKFINIDKVDYVIGYACSNTALVTAPLYERAKKVVVITCASSPEISDAGEYIFRTTPSDLFASKTLFDFVKGRYKTVGILTEQSDYAVDLRNAFVKANEQDGKVVTVVDEEFISGSNDFRSQLLKLNNANLDVLFVNPQSDGAYAAIVKKIKEMHWDVPIIGAYMPASPNFLKLARDEANGIEFVDTPGLSDILNPEGMSLYREYAKKYAPIRATESVFASTVEAFRVLDAAIGSTQDVRKYLSENSFQGIFGEYSFDANGDISGLNFMMKRIKNGTPEAIQ